MLGYNKLGLLLVASVFCSAAIAEQSIVDRTTKVTSRLEVMNSLGRQCEMRLQADGMPGSASDACEKYLTNMQGAYFGLVGEECASLGEWYESTRQTILADPEAYSDDPQEAERVLADMRAVQGVCHPNNFKNYPYLLKPSMTIKALSELE